MNSPTPDPPRLRPLTHADLPAIAAVHMRAFPKRAMSALGVDVVHLQVQQLHAPHAGAVEHFEHGSVAHAGGGAEIGHREHDLGLLDRQDVLWQALLHPRQFEVGRRVVENEVLPGQPLEPGADRRDADVLAARGQGLAVLLAVHEDEALVALDDRPRHVLRPLDATLVAPLDEEAQVHLAAGDRRGRVVLLAQPRAEAAHVVVKTLGVARVADRRARRVLAFARHGLRRQRLRKKAAGMTASMRERLNVRPVLRHR